MKKLVVLAIAACFTMAGFAQEETKKQAKTPEQRAEKITAKLKEKLDLTDEQVTKIKTINLDAAKKKETVKTDAAQKRKEMKEKAKAIEADRDAKIKEVLTDAQKLKYDEMQKKMKEKRKAHKGKKKNKDAEGGTGGGDVK